MNNAPVPKPEAFRVYGFCGAGTISFSSGIDIFSAPCYAEYPAVKQGKLALPNGRRFSDTTRKGVKRLRITITFHIWNWTVSIVFKRGNRHSAKK